MKVCADRRTLPTETFRGLVRSRDLIHDRWADPLHVAHMAREAGLSRYHFIRAFERAFGATPHRYMIRLRLAKAKELLRRPGVSVTEACFETGFLSLGSWSSLFAREFGQTPSAFRREMVRLYQVPAPFQRAFAPLCFLAHFAGAISEKRGRAGA